MAGKKLLPKLPNVANKLEAVGSFNDLGNDFKSSVKDNAFGAADDFFTSLLGIESTKDKKSSSKSEPVDLVDFKSQATERKAAKPESRIEAAIDYHRDIVRSSERASRTELQTMNNQIQQIMQELKSLIGTSKMLQMEFAEISMDQTTENVGVYHANFFEWMLSVIQAARMKVEDSEAWLNTQKSKGSKKGYWGMFKKHGTSFGLSNERSVATQVG